MPLWGSGLNFSDFKILKCFKFEFYGFKKIGTKLFEITDLRKIFDENLVKMHLFLAKFSTFQKWIRLSFNFRVFLQVRVLVIFRDWVFFVFGFGKVPKSCRVFEFG